MSTKNDDDNSKPARKRSQHIVAQKAKASPDAQFLALLRRKCIRAATIGAATAAAESIPGLGSLLGFVFGELLDAQFLAAVQRELVEETFALYGLELPPSLHMAVISQVQVVGTGASIASDALVRRALQKTLGRIGSVVAKRVLPVASIVSSALSNAMITYAIGKRAQAVAKLRDAPIRGMPDVLRAFSGVDERRVYAWTMEAVDGVLSSIGDTFRKWRPWGRKAAAAPAKKVAVRKPRSKK